MKTVILFKYLIVCCCFLLAISNAHSQDADDIADDALDNIDTRRVGDLARAARNNAYTVQAKEVAREKEGVLKETGRSDPNVAVGTSYTQEQGEGHNTLFKETRTTRENSDVSIGSESALLNSQKAVKSSMSGLGQSYEDCVDMSSESVIESTTAECPVGATYNELQFECIKSGFNVCENMTARSLNGDRGERSIAELGVALIGQGVVLTGAGNDSEQPYTITQDLQVTAETFPENERCAVSEYSYQLIVPPAGQLVDLGLQMEMFTGRVEVWVNDEQILESGDAAACEAAEVPFTVQDGGDMDRVSIITNLTGETNTVRVRYSHPQDAPPIRFSVDGYGREPCMESDYVVTECPAEIPDEIRQRATLLNETCIQPVDHVIYMDRVIETDCTQWQQEYELVEGPIYSETSECASYVEQGCSLVSTECTAEHLERCPEYLRTYRCDTTVPVGDDLVTLCGDTLACRDGECAEELQEVPDNTEDFKESSIWLQILTGMDSDIDLAQGDSSFFSGRAARCEDNLASNCCADSGWGLWTGLSECYQEEKELGYAKQEGRAIEVGGDRDTINILGARFTTARYKVYCTFDSPVARVFLQQANAQLNRNFGTGPHPNCSGLDLDDFADLDFDRMDFSELYPTAGNSANTVPPDVEKMIQNMTETDPCKFSASGECQ